MELPLTPTGESSAPNARKKRDPKPALSLRPPKEHTRSPLAAGLLIASEPGAPPADDAGLSGHTGIVGPAHVRASGLGRGVPATAEPARVFASLDVAPELLAEPQVEVVRYILDVSADDLADALTIDAPGPVAVAVRGGGLPVRECAERAVAAGRSLVLPADATADDVADFQSSFAHSPAGYLAEADDAAGVLRVLACAAAGISGFDVRAAFAEPDAEYLRSLSDMAADAVRELLLGVLVPAPPAVARELAELGFGAAGDVEQVPGWYV